MFRIENFARFDANDAGNAGANDGSNGNGNSAGSSTSTTQAPTYEEWTATLTDDQKGLLDGHVKGLKTALDSERGSRKEMEKQLRDLAKKAEAGSEAQGQLTKLADSLALEERRAEFYEAAHNVGIRNLKLAFTVASTDGLFDAKGRVNFDEMKKGYPELFAAVSAAPRGDAGSGTQGSPAQGGGMNDFIRKASGRG